MSWVEGKTVVITGGSSGIGKGVAFALAAQGAQVVLAGRNPDRLERTVEHIRERGFAALGVPTDVGSQAQVDQLMDRALERFGSIDGLVTAAGMGTVGPLLAEQPTVIDETVRTDLMGTIYSVRAAAVHMEPGSQIVTVASLMAGQPSTGMPLYAAVKSAILVLSDSIREELSARGIRLTCLSPGPVVSHFQDGWGEEEFRALAVVGKDGTSPDLEQIMRARDIAPAVLFALELPERSRGATLAIF